MSIATINKFRSVRFWLPALLVLLTLGGGAILYVFEARKDRAGFEAAFEKDESLRASRAQAEIERWIQRNDLDMVQSILAEMAVMPELKSALFLDATNTVLSAARRECIGQPFDFEQLDVSRLEPERLLAAMEKARKTMRGISFFTGDHNGLVSCFPTSLPLRPGELEAHRGGLILISYDFRAQKIASLNHVRTEFLTYFGGIAVIALVLGVCLHFLITRRLGRLKSAMMDFAVGKSVAEPPAARFGDEISQLVAHFHEMAGTLRKTMAEIQDLYDQAPCGYHSLDQDGVFLQINATELQWLGCTRDEIVGKKRFSDFVSQHSRPRFQAEFLWFKERGWVKNLEFEIVGQDGTVRPVLVSATIIRDQAGNYLMSRSTVYDITERKRADEALRINEQRYRMAQSIGRVGNWEYNLQSGEFWGSDEARRIYGFTPGQTTFTTEEVESRIPERERVHQALVDLIEAGKPYDLEFEIHSKDFPEPRIISSIAKLQRDEQGHPMLVMGVIQDITERKRAEQHLALLSFALNNVREAAFLIDEQACFRFVNEEACRALGYTRRELLALGVPDVDPDFPKGQWGKHWEELRARRAMNFEGRHRAKDGRDFPVEINANFIEYGGRAYNLALVRDITGRKRAAQRLAEAEAKYRCLVEESLVGVYLIQQGRFVYVNACMARVFGYRQEEVAGRPVDDLVAPEDRGRVAGNVEKRETGEVPSMHYTFHGLRKDGQIIDVEVLGTRTVYNDRPAVIGSLLDITERKRAEEEIRKLNVKLEQRVRQRTQELAASEQRFRTIYDTAPVSIWQEDWTEVIAMIEPLRVAGVTDFEAWFREHLDFVSRALGAVKIQDVNQWTLDMFAARDKAEMLASLGTVFATPDTLSGFIGELAALAQGKSVYRTEMALNTVKGGQIHSLLSMSFPPPGSDAGHVLVSLIDITERKQAEKALQRQAAIIDLSPDAIIVRKLDGTILSWSRGAETIYGWTKEEACGQQTHSFLHTQFSQPLEEIQKQIQKTGRWSGELVHRAKDGHAVIVQSWWLPQFGAQGRPVEMLESNVDITDRKHTEDALRASEERMRLFFERQLVGMAFTSPEKGWIQANDKLCQMLGYAREELTRLTWSEMTYPDDLAPDVAQFERLLNGEIEGYTLEKRFVRKDGSLVFTNLAVGCVRRADRSVDYVLAMLEDITKRKQAEENIQKLNAELQQRAALLESANKELESFSYSVSHDLRAPLRSVDGFSRLLLEQFNDKLDDKGRDYLRRVCAASQRMGHLIDDLLMLSRITRGELHHQPVDLSVLAAMVADNLQKTEPQRRVRWSIAPRLTAQGDPRLLQIVLENLLGNAWKFTGKQPAPRIEFGVMERHGARAFFVRDNGAGFDMTYAGKLFGAFQRLHAAADFPGTGIGLATVQRIIRRHGGQIEAEGVTGRGATFYFTLPQPNKTS